MTHSKLVDEIAWWMHGAPKARVRRTLALFVDAVLDECKAGGSVSIPGFGVFRRVTRKARYITNPRTGERMALPEMATLKFTAAKAAKERMR